MKIEGKHYRAIWTGDDPGAVKVIDQRKLPFQFEVLDLKSSDDAFQAIADMAVRGAPLIGVTGAFGLYLAAFRSSKTHWYEELVDAAQKLVQARPTAVNLKYGINLLMERADRAGSRASLIRELFHMAQRFAEDEVHRSRKIGEHGFGLIKEAHQMRGDTVNILTHCNAGWLACVDYGTATAPIYLAHDRGIPVHVWVDETRPRNQGARLTAWELSQHGVPHTVIVDSAGGHLMQQGKVDLVLVGSDRTTRQGDVTNKIGTYLKALAAYDNHIPFYVALPSSSIDFSLSEAKEIHIEKRDDSEVTHMAGWNADRQQEESLRIMPPDSKVSNPGFDVTPARLVTALITEKGMCEPSEDGIRALFSY